MGKISKFDQNINTPVIAGVEITTDEQGRINLNALHKASGGEKKNGPSYWLALEATQDLVSEFDLQTTGISVVTREGRGGGTYVAEELAVSYAGWISPAFQLEVNRTFIAVRKGTTQMAPIPDDKLSREVRLHARELTKLGKLCGLEGAQLAFSVNAGVERITGVNLLGDMGIKRVETSENEDLLNVRDLGALVGCTAQEMNLKLIGRGLQTTYRDTKGNKKYELTEEGKALGGTWCDVQKAQGGRPIRQLVWAPSVAELFQGEASA